MHKKIDVLVTISNKKNMIFQSEILRRSLVKNSNLDFNFHLVIVNDGPIGNWIPFYNENLYKEIKKNCYTLAKNSFIWKSECHWQDHLPVRWHVPIQSENFLFLDADMIVTGDLSEITENNTHDICGVPTVAQNIPLEIWKDHLGYKNLSIETWKKILIEKKCNFTTTLTNEFIPTCFNFGFLLFNRLNFLEIRKSFTNNVKNYVNSNLSLEHKKFCAQLALTATILQLEIKFKKLDLKYNLPDFDCFFKHLNNCKVLHYLNSKNISSDYFLNMPDLNQYQSIMLKYFLEFYPKI